MPTSISQFRLVNLKKHTLKFTLESTTNSDSIRKSHCHAPYHYVLKNKTIHTVLYFTGPEYTSVEFSKVFYKSVEKGGATVSFIIGGFAGLPPAIKDTYPLLSLSKLTWTHQMVRLLLTEQVYRAVEIYKGSEYHKE